MTNMATIGMLLTAAACKYGPMELYIGDDGQLHA